MLGVGAALMPYGNHVVFQIFHNMHGRQDLPCQVGRTNRGAPSANRARIPVQKLLPSEVLDPRRAEPLGVFQVHRRQHSPRLQGAEKGIHGRGHHVHVFGKGNVDHEAENYSKVRPPGHCLENVRGGGCQAQSGKPFADGASNKHAGLGSFAASGNVKCVSQQRGDHQRSNQGHHYDRVPVTRQIET